MLCGVKKEAVDVCTYTLTKEAVLYRIIRLACTAFNLPFTDEITSSVMERENKLSTGIGLGIAVPHCRNDRVKSPVFAALLAPAGIDYDSVDGQPVKLVFLIVSPQEDIQVHLACLSAISHAVSDEKIRLKLINSSTPEELFEHLSRVEI